MKVIDSDIDIDIDIDIDNDYDIDIDISTWFTDVVETIGFTVFALNSLTIIISSTDSSKSLIAVSISLTFVWNFLASIGIRVTEVSGLNNMGLMGFYKV